MSIFTEPREVFLNLYELKNFTNNTDIYITQSSTDIILTNNYPVKN